MNIREACQTLSVQHSSFISGNISEERLKHVFKKKLFATHPDLHGGKNQKVYTEKTRKLIEAYRVLSEEIGNKKDIEFNSFLDLMLRLLVAGGKLYFIFLYSTFQFWLDNRRN